LIGFAKDDDAEHVFVDDAHSSSARSSRSRSPGAVRRWRARLRRRDRRRVDATTSAG
jgi:hypothetical protein